MVPIVHTHIDTHTRPIHVCVCICAASHNNNGLTTLKMCVKCARATRIVPAFNGFIGLKPRPAKQWVNETPLAAPAPPQPGAQPP